MADNRVTPTKLGPLCHVSIHVSLEQITADEGAPAVWILALEDLLGAMVELVTISAPLVSISGLWGNSDRKGSSPTDVRHGSSSSRILGLCIQTSCRALYGSVSFFELVHLS